MSDLWPQDLTATTTRSPLTILKEQASLLGEKTTNIVKASVRKDSGHSDEDITTAFLRRAMSEKHNETASFRYTFSLQAPALDNYRYRLFRVSFGVDFYPVSFFVDDAIAKELGTNSGKGFVAANEEEFNEILAKILSSQKTRHVVQAIYSQSVEIGEGIANSPR